MTKSHRGTLAYETLLAQPRSLALLALNAIGAIVYVARASNAWAIPQERTAGVY
jgi:hypothetical protein